MSCGVRGVTPEWVQRQHCDHGFGEGRGKCSGRWDKVSQSELQMHLYLLSFGRLMLLHMTYKVMQFAKWIHFRYLHRNNLYKTSFYITLTSISISGFGFLFWIFAAKLYSPSDVGIATALISSLSLIVLLSRFGFDQSLIRDLPKGDKGTIIGTSLIFTTSIAVLLAIIFMVSINIWAPDLNSISINDMVLYFGFLIASSIVSVTGNSFIAMRKAEIRFFQNIILGSRVIFLFPLAIFGFSGIFGSFGISFILAAILALVSLRISKIRIGFFSIGYFKESIHFSLGNFFTSSLMTASNQILPLLVFNTLGAEDAAVYYIASTIATVLFIIPNSISTSLFVEGSHGEALNKILRKSCTLTLGLLVPAVIIIVLAGHYILDLVEPTYIRGLIVLQTVAISSFFVTIVYTFLSIKRIQNDIRMIFTISVLLFALLIPSCYIAMILFGLNGIGYAWFVSYGLTALISVIILLNEKTIKGNSFFKKKNEIAK